MAVTTPQIKWSRNPAVRAQQLQGIQEPQEWASQAAINALLKYAPQKQALAELKREAEARHGESIRAGQTESILGRRAAQEAEPATKQIFTNARTAGEAGRNLSAPILAALAPTSPFRAAAANEQTAGTERLGESEAHALSDLQARRVAASELPAFTRQQADTKLASELAKIIAKGELLRGSQAADVQAEIGKQRSEANKLREQERIAEGRELAAERRSERQNLGAEKRSERQAETTRQYTTSTSRENAQESNRTRKEVAAETNRVRKEVAAEKAKRTGGPGGIKPATTVETNKTRDMIERIRHEAYLSRSDRSEGYVNYNEAKAHLEQPSKALKRKGWANDGVLGAGLDLAYFGHVGRGNMQKLHQEGYSLKKLGYPVG